MASIVKRLRSKIRSRWVTRKSRPKSSGYEVTPELYNFLVDTAATPVPVDRLRGTVNQRRKFGYVYDIGGGLAQILLAFAPIAAPFIYFYNYSPRPTTDQLTGFVVIVTAVCWGTLAFLLHRQARFHRETHMIRTLLNAIRRCDEILADPRDYYARNRLASTLDSAAGVFYKIYRRPPMDSAPRLHRKQWQRLARDGSQALLSGALGALGSPQEIRDIRSSIAHAILRVEGKDWIRVREVRDFSQIQELRPSWTSRLFPAVNNQTFLAVLGFLTAVAVLIAAVVS